MHSMCIRKKDTDKQETLRYIEKKTLFPRGWRVKGYTPVKRSVTDRCDRKS
jgi:hypothetical protein